MDPNILSVLLLMSVPIAILLLIGLLVYLTRRWQKEIDQASLLTGRGLEEARQQTQELRKVQEEFAAMHRQPYMDIAAELLGHVESLEDGAGALEDDWQALETRRKNPVGGRLTAVINAIPETYTQRQMVDQLGRQRTELEEHLVQGRSAVHKLHVVPVEIAGQSRDAVEGIRQFEMLLGEMHEAGLHGRMIDEADDALLRLEQDRARFPEGFTGSGEAKTVRLAASDLFDLLRNVQPVLGEWLPRIRSWQHQHVRSLEGQDRLQKTAVTFRSALTLPPPTLIVNRFQAGLLQISAAAEELNIRLRSAEVQELRGLEREISHLERTLQEMVVQYDRSVQQVAQLDRLLLELESDFKVLIARLADAEFNEMFPLAWDGSRPLKDEIQEQIASLGSREMKRTPEQVEAALAGGKEIAGRLAALLTRTSEQLERYKELIALLVSAQLADGAEWALRASQLTREVGVYDPANWSRGDEIGSLGRGVAALEEQQRRLVPLEKPATVKESSLAKRLEETRALGTLHARMRPRVEQVRARLVELRRQDKDTRDDLERLSTTLEQVALLLNGSAYLQETAAAELGRLRADVTRLEAELAQPETGTLERKSARLRLLMETSAKAISGWLDRLSANLQVHTRSISDALAALDGVGRIDDREVTDSREMLRRIGLVPSYARASNYMEAAAALKRCAADWQAAAASASALEQFSAPVLSAMRDAEQARKSLGAVLQSSPKLASGRRDWPPTRSALEGDVIEFRKLESRLDGLRAQRTSASNLVRELGLIYHDLDKIDDHAAQALRSAESERSAVTEVERTVADLARRLETLGTRYPDQPGVGDGARDLQKQCEQRLAYLRAQYRRGGMDYDQVLNGLEDLEASLRAARFSTDDGRSVGIDS